jgi:hypothetical protein
LSAIFVVALVVIGVVAPASADEASAERAVTIATRRVDDAVRLGEKRTTRPEWQAEFRKRIVREFGWRPGGGVALTTTAYARNYLERRRHVFERHWTGPSRHTLTPWDSDALLVLFQTKTLDILVMHRQMNARERMSVQHPEPRFFVFERESGDRQFSGIIGSISRGYAHRGDPRFVEIDGAPPQELQYDDYYSDMGFRNDGTHIFGFRDDGLRELFEVDRHTCYDPGPAIQFYNHRFSERCPGLFADDASLEKSDIVAGSTFTYREVPVAKMPHKARQCGYYLGAAPVVERTCTYSEERDSFDCSIRVVETADVKNLQDIKVGANWKKSAENIRYVLDNVDRLRELGFRFPGTFLDDLKNHLPASDPRRKK